jgi:hypothetical protein
MPIDLAPEILSAVLIEIVLALIPLLIWGMWQAEGWLATWRRGAATTFSSQ